LAKKVDRGNFRAETCSAAVEDAGVRRSSQEFVLWSTCTIPVDDGHLAESQVQGFNIPCIKESGRVENVLHPSFTLCGIVASIFQHACVNPRCTALSKSDWTVFGHCHRLGSNRLVLNACVRNKLDDAVFSALESNELEVEPEEKSSRGFSGSNLPEPSIERQP
jgi:hypothetical protein